MNAKNIVRFFVLIFFLIIGSLFFSDLKIRNNAKSKLFVDVNKIPKNKVGLLLGTSKVLSNGRINLYYKYRLQTVISLYRAGKIEYILVSGDNGSQAYDEPTAFKEDLLKAGIPENRIVLDYAGFRTLDSVVRAKEIFGQNSITIISQKFHNERAIYLAEYFKIKAIGFNARDLSVKYGLKTKIREYFARVKVFVDIVTGKQPKFLGEKIKI